MLDRARSGSSGRRRRRKTRGQLELDLKRVGARLHRGFEQDVRAWQAGADQRAVDLVPLGIVVPARFAPWVDAIDPNSELGKLLANPSPTPAELVRENRLLLELAYDAEISKSVLAAYRLVSVPSGSTEISAKTAWNLRLRSTMGPTINWVNNGVPAWQNGSDRYLRGGDLTGDNAVNLFDYNATGTRINNNDFLTNHKNY